MEKLIARLRQDYPHLSFTTGSMNCWSPSDNVISYAIGNNESALASVLHEVAHALLEHTDYANDLELLRKEVKAWEKAMLLAPKYQVVMHDDHIQTCLDTYREWVHKRSLCPICSTSGLQKTQIQYTCINCRHNWEVTNSRLCRPYRRSAVREQIKTGA